MRLYDASLMRQLAEDLDMGCFIANACGDPLNCKDGGKTSVTFKEKSSIIIDEANAVEYIKYDAQFYSAPRNAHRQVFACRARAVSPYAGISGVKCVTGTKDSWTAAGW